MTSENASKSDSIQRCFPNGFDATFDFDHVVFQSNYVLFHYRHVLLQKKTETQKQDFHHPQHLYRPKSLLKPQNPQKKENKRAKQLTITMSNQKQANY